MEKALDSNPEFAGFHARAAVLRVCVNLVLWCMWVIHVYIYMYIYIHIHTYIRTYIHIYMHAYISCHVMSCHVMPCHAM